MADLSRVLSRVGTALTVVSQEGVSVDEVYKALGDAVGDEGEVTVEGRRVRYTATGYFYRWELNFEAEAVDVDAPWLVGRAKHFVSKSTAVQTAIQDLLSKQGIASADQQPVQPAPNTPQQPVQPAPNTPQHPVEPAPNTPQQPVQPAPNTPQQPVEPAPNTTSQTQRSLSARKSSNSSTGRAASSSEEGLTQPTASPTYRNTIGSLDDRPSMVQMLTFHTKSGEVSIPQQISTNYMTFGVLLLDDHTCTVVSGITHKHMNNPVAINIEILQQWMSGRGRMPVSWRTLVGVLRATGLNVLAGDVCSVFSGGADTLRDDDVLD